MVLLSKRVRIVMTDYKKILALNALNCVVPVCHYQEFISWLVIEK